MFFPKATMAVLRDMQRTVDTMKVVVIGEDGEQPAEKSIYAVGGIKWGPFRDVEDRFSKYWIWGSLKPYAAYVFCAFKDLTWSCESKFRYTIPCDGCSNCAKERIVGGGSQNTFQQTRWWHAFVPRTKTLNGINLLIECDLNCALHFISNSLSNFRFQRLFSNCES